MKRFLRILIGSPDRVIATISLISGVISLGFSVYVYRVPSPLPGYIILRDLSIVVVLVLIITTIFVKYYMKYSMVERFRSLLAEQLKSHHQMIHKFRDYFFLLIRNELVTGGKLEQSRVNELRKEYFEKVARTVLMDTRELFLEYFRARDLKVGDDLTLTIKIIIGVDEAQQILNNLKGSKANILNKDGKYIVTGYRDPYTWEKKPERNEIMQIVYDIDAENTTFDEILSKNIDKGYYFCNNLRKEANEGQYRNQNPKWQKRYNAVSAVPIRFRFQGNPYATILYGVLSADSMNPRAYELFDDAMTYNMLASAADVLALMFGHLDMLQLTLKGS